MLDNISSSQNMKVIHVESFEIQGPSGIKFSTRRVDKGDLYGKQGALIHEEDEAMIEFYDTRFPFDLLGQFIARYYISTLLAHDAKKGLDLHGDVPDWKIDAASLQRVIERWTNGN